MKYILAAAIVALFAALFAVPFGGLFAAIGYSATIASFITIAICIDDIYREQERKNRMIEYLDRACRIPSIY